MINFLRIRKFMRMFLLVGFSLVFVFYVERSSFDKFTVEKETRSVFSAEKTQDSFQGLRSSIEKLPEKTIDLQNFHSSEIKIEDRSLEDLYEEIQRISQITSQKEFIERIHVSRDVEEIKDSHKLLEKLTLLRAMFYEEKIHDLEGNLERLELELDR